MFSLYHFPDLTTIVIYICGKVMQEDSGGQTEVMSCPQSAALLQRAVVFASPIPGLMNTGWWATKLTHKVTQRY